MDCQGCGACCLDESVPVNKKDRKLIPAEYIDEGGCLKKTDGHCVFFNVHTRQCGNYNSRPHACRAMPVGCGRCHLSRVWAEIELDWFGSTPQLPAEGSFDSFYERVQHTDAGEFTIASIRGRHSSQNREAIARYNDAVKTANEW